MKNDALYQGIWARGCLTKRCINYLRRTSTYGSNSKFVIVVLEAPDKLQVHASAAFVVMTIYMFG